MSPWSPTPSKRAGPRHNGEGDPSGVGGSARSTIIPFSHLFLHPSLMKANHRVLLSQGVLDHVKAHVFLKATSFYHGSLSLLTMYLLWHLIIL